MTGGSADVCFAAQMDVVLRTQHVAAEAVVPFRSRIVLRIDEGMRTRAEPNNRLARFHVVRDELQLFVRQREEPHAEDRNISLLQRIQSGHAAGVLLRIPFWQNDGRAKASAFQLLRQFWHGANRIVVWRAHHEDGVRFRVLLRGGLACGEKTQRTDTQNGSRSNRQHCITFVRLIKT